MSAAQPRTSPVDAAIVLTGGAGRRLGGRDKAMLTVHRGPLIDVVLAAVVAVPAVVVVGPQHPTPYPVRFTREDPPGAGPAAAVAAGVAALHLGGLVAVLAVDLPGLTAGTVARLAAAVQRGPDGTDGADGPDGAVLVDADGREQLLLGVWRSASLAAATVQRDSWTGVSLRELLAPLSRVALPALGDEAADVDTPEDLRRWRS